MIEAAIVSPSSNVGHSPHQTFIVSVEQVADDFMETGYATLQFSMTVAGPWATCGYIGQGGSATANRIPWNHEDETVNIATQIVQTVWLRFGVWPDETCQGEPQENPSDPIRVFKIEPQTGP